MEFIEVKINSNSTLKMLSKRWRRRPLKVKQRRIKKAEKPNPRRNNLARPCQAVAVPRGTVVPPSTARPCHFSGRPAVLGLGCTVRAPNSRPCFRLFRACYPPLCSS